MTRQYGVFDQYMIDLKNTRILKNLFSKLDDKVECLNSTSGVWEGCRDTVQYHHFVQHDITLITLINLFDLEQSWELMRYAATFLIELHLDDSDLSKCQGDIEDCLYIKVFFNSAELFSELSFCDFQTGLCPYKRFLRAMKNKMLHNIDSDAACLEPFDPEELKGHAIMFT